MRKFILGEDGHRYYSDDYWTLAREYGRTPNGTLINGSWVLRNKGEWVDFSQYRVDLMERNKFEIDTFDYQLPPKKEEKLICGITTL